MLEQKSPGAGGGLGDSRYMFRSLLFLAVLGVLGFYFQGPLLSGFNANPPLNGTILGILAFGIVYTFQALIGVFLLERAARRAAVLVESAQRGERPLQQVNEVLLSPSQRGLADFLHTVHRVLQSSEATATLPYLLDSVAARGEDRRALVRYLTGALVLLGLIGTFYGLLVTIDGVRGVIGNIATDADADTIALLTGLKERLSLPLAGMGLAFSSSLFGLLASLVLAFVELQLFHAQNSLHARLETLVVSELVPLWQSGSSRGQGLADAPTSPRYVTALLEATAERLDRVAGLLESNTKNDGGAARLTEQVAGLGQRIDTLRESLESLERDRTADLRHELRMMSRALMQDNPPHAPEA